MAKSSINRSLCLAGLIAVLSTETVQAGSSLGAKAPSNKKLYHERNGSQIEELFRKLPSVENEVESVFDDASFLSSFGASPQADKESNKDVEELFRRILLSQEGGHGRVEQRSLSFLGNKVNEAGVFGGSGIGNRGSIRGSTSTSTDIETSAGLFEDSEGAVVEQYMKNSKSGKKEHKEMKKQKRYKGKIETNGGNNIFVSISFVALIEWWSTFNSQFFLLPFKTFICVFFCDHTSRGERKNST